MKNAKYPWHFENFSNCNAFVEGSKLTNFKGLIPMVVLVFPDVSPPLLGR
jgi:hypothetical protein